MANLPSHLKIDRILSNNPFGDGKDGSVTISSDPNVRALFSGTSGSTLGTAGASTMNNGDLVLIIQLQGSGAGNQEINMVAGGGGSINLTMAFALTNTYSNAQIIKIPRYTTAVIGAHSVTPWDEATKLGGIEIISAKVSATISGLWNGSAKGFIGGGSSINGIEFTGNGTVGSSVSQSSANGNGGGGGEDCVGNDGSGGGGGGNGGAGSNGNAGIGGKTVGSGGGAVGSADLITPDMGGGGGGGGASHDGSWHFGANGGTGGGIIICITNNLIVSSNVSVDGGAGGAGTPSGAHYTGGGGGGGGGSLLIVCNTATLGTGNVTALAGGAGISGGGSGGAGGVGRIAIHHAGTVTGTTSPSFTDITDLTLMERGGGALVGGIF